VLTAQLTVDKHREMVLVNVKFKASRVNVEGPVITRYIIKVSK